MRDDRTIIFSHTLISRWTKQPSGYVWRNQRPLALSIAISSLWIQVSTLSFPVVHHFIFIIFLMTGSCKKKVKLHVKSNNTKKPLWEVSIGAELIDKETLIFHYTTPQQCDEVWVSDMWWACNFPDKRLDVSIIDNVLDGNMLFIW